MFACCWRTGKRRISTATRRCWRDSIRGGPSGFYKIVKQMPSESEDRQYRIKSAGEAHERVVNESQLSRD